MSFFSGLDTEGYDRQYTDRQLTQRIWTYFVPYRIQLIWVAFYTLLIAGADAAVPVLVARVVGELSTTGVATSSDFHPQRGGVCGGGCSWAANWVRRRITVRIVGNIVLTLRTDAFRAAASHDLSFYDEYASGKVVSRITSDTQEFGQMVVLVTDLVAQVVQAVLSGRNFGRDRLEAIADPVRGSAGGVRSSSGLPQAGAPGNPRRDAGDGERQRHDQRDGQRHLGG